jgi:hypothetical protein
MRLFNRQSRLLIAFFAIAALIFAHSAMAMEACFQHLDATPAEAAHGHADQAEHSHESDNDADSLLCQVHFQAKAQSRDYVKVFELPAPVAQAIFQAVPCLKANPWPVAPAQPRLRYASATHPPPLLVLFSRLLI